MSDHTEETGSDLLEGEIKPQTYVHRCCATKSSGQKVLNARCKVRSWYRLVYEAVFFDARFRKSFHRYHDFGDRILLRSIAAMEVERAEIFFRKMCFFLTAVAQNYSNL